MLYKYLKDKEFLKRFDQQRHKEQYVRITILDFKTENTIAAIEGVTTSGSVNVSGTSSMRRTASLSLSVHPDGVYNYTNGQFVSYHNITEVQNLVSMNKKIRIETGFKNSLASYGYYPEYSIIWFPLGTFVIKTANIAKSNNGVNISLTLNDKAALLNGDMGGVIPAGTIFSEQEIFNRDGTDSTIEKLLIKDIIRSIVTEFGGEKPENVIINDIPDVITKVVKWTGSGILFQFDYLGGTYFTTNDPTKKGFIDIKGLQLDVNDKDLTKHKYGEDVGRQYEKFVYPGTLECNAGETVASVLDKIKNVLGNYEWFYDLDGRFIFQEIKNYLNNSITKSIVKLSAEDYLSSANLDKSVYTFDNSNLITSISNAPQYQNIKNDFVVWGVAKTATGSDKPIRYHLAFDTKPTVSNEARYCLVYKDYKGLRQVIILKENENFSYLTSRNVPTDANKRFYYLLWNDTLDHYDIYHWDEDTEEYINVYNAEDCFVCYLTTDDWRTELYFLGLEVGNKTFIKNYYSAELNAEWPKIYDVAKTQAGTGTGVDFIPIYINNEKGKTIPKYTGGYRDNIDETNYEYWLDFLDEGVNSQFNVNNIGRRTKVVSDNSSNCIFAKEIPNVAFVNADGNVSDEILGDTEVTPVVQVSPEIYSKLVVGGSHNSAFDKVRELLFQHTQYNESISLSVIPIYYLEPNTRITVHDSDVAVNGDYLIKTISLPLTVGGTSNISATRCIEKE